MKDMVELNVILGIKILRNDKCITLLQSHYVHKILKWFEYFNMSPMFTLYDSKVHLLKNHGDKCFTSKYAQIIRSLMVLMNYT